MTEKIQVLYIDDEADLLIIGKRFLESFGSCSVATVLGGVEAFGLLKTRHFDVIVSDYLMPKMDGITLLKHLKAEGNKTPFILFTGKGREDVVIEALNHGADFYLQKGGDPRSQFAELEHKIRQAVSLRRSQEYLSQSVEELTRKNEELTASTEELQVMVDEIARNKEEIERREAQFTTMAANIPGVVYRFSVNPDMTYGFDYISERSREILGLENDPDIFLEKVIACIIPENKERLLRSINKAISTPTLWEFESEFIRPSGERIWLKGISNPIIENNHLFFDGVISDITNQKLAEIAVRNSETLYKTIFNTTGTATIIIDKNTKILMANSGFASISGYSIEELEGKKNWTEFVVPEDRDLMLRYHHDRRINPENGVRVYEFRFVNRYGEVRNCINNVSLIPGTLRSVASILDIHERITAETELRIQHEKLQASYENLASLEEELRLSLERLTKQDEVLRHKSNTLTILNSIISTANKADNLNDLLSDILDESLRILNFSAGGIYIVNQQTRMVDLVCYRNLPPGFIQEIQSLAIDSYPYDTLFIKKESIITENYEKFAPERSSRYGFLSLVSIPLISKGTAIGAMNLTSTTRYQFTEEEKETLKSVGRELGSTIERMLAEERIIKSEEKYRRLAEHAQDMIYQMSLPDGRYDYVNPAAEELTGYKPEDYYQNPVLIRSLIHPDWVHYFQQEWDSLIKGDMPPSYEYQIIDRSGRARWFYQRNILLRDEAGIPAGIEGIVTDITERKQAEESLYEAIKKIRLLTGLTRHDIFNQLTSIQSYHILAMDETDISLIHEYLALAHQVGMRLEKTIKFTREYENFGLVSSGWQQVHSVIESAKTEVELKNISVENQVEQELDVYADPIIRKVFTTLLENAIRHGEKISAIRFYSKEIESKMIIICEDDGVGISADEKNFIFDHGYGSHTGIGLFLAREILSITGISITESGNPGEGARFEIIIPGGKYRLSK